MAKTPNLIPVRRDPCHPGCPICAVLRGGPSMGPKSNCLRPSELQQMPGLPYCARVGADVGDERRAGRCQTAPATAPLHCGPPVAATFGRLLRVAIAFDAPG